MSRDFESNERAEAERAIEAGDFIDLEDGRYMDPNTGNVYDEDGNEI